MTFVVETLTAIASVLLLVIGIAMQPQRASCPPGWHHEGVRVQSGAFHCVRDFVGGADDEIPPPGTLRSRIYCTGGAARVVDERSVWCAR